MNHTYQYVESWTKNTIKFFTSEHKFKENELTVVQELPTGKLIEIMWDGIKFSYSSDSKHEGNKDSQIDKYLKKYIYGKLSYVADTFFNCTIHIYGFIGKSGFQAIDIFVNENFLDYKLIKETFKDAGIKTPKAFFTGKFSNFKSNQHKSFLIRSFYEPVGERTIRYKRVK